MKRPRLICVLASTLTAGAAFAYGGPTTVPATRPASRPTTHPTTHPATYPATRPTTHPATTRATSRPAPTTRVGSTRGKTPEQKAAEDAIRTAVLALTKEAQDALRKEGGAMPRALSDYFKGQSPGIDQETLLAAIDKQIATDPRVDAYVKFELLSAIDKFDAANANAAINAYVKAPALVPLPIMSQREQQIWERKAMNIKEGDVGKINDDFKQQQSAAEAIDAPMVAYRDAIRDKITVDDTSKTKLLEARVEEMSQRATAGIETAKTWQTLHTEILKWSALASKTDLTNMLTFLKEYQHRTGPTVPDVLKWSTSERNPHAYWHERKAELDPKRLDALIEALQKAQTNAV